MSDTISRQAAIDALVGITMFKTKHELMQRVNASVQDEQGWLGAVAECLDEIEDLPSAQPEQRWIPCSERLPKIRQWVLCQCRAGIIDVLRLTDDGCWYRKSNEIYMSGFVLAWMPLPEPYRGGEK